MVWHLGSVWLSCALEDLVGEPLFLAAWAEWAQGLWSAELHQVSATLAEQQGSVAQEVPADLAVRQPGAVAVPAAGGQRHEQAGIGGAGGWRSVAGIPPASAVGLSEAEYGCM